MQKTFKVLSIDGGGIKGIYSARILFLLEEQLKKKFNDPNISISDYCDLICGTSTGGLIALGLSLRQPTKVICEFYEKNATRIFPQPNSLYRKLRQTLFKGKYSDKYLKKALNDFFCESVIGDSNNLLCIPSYDFTHGTYALFKFDHKEGNLSRHNRLKYADVGLCTSAAPTFFPLAQIQDENNSQYLDGGVWANNPALVGFAESIKYFVGEGKEYSRLQILSISNLNISNGQPPMEKRSRSFFNWNSELFEPGLIAQSEFSDFFLNTVSSHTKFPLEYIRIPSANISGKQSKYIGLDQANIKSLNLMKQFADDMFYKYKNNEKIIAFFSQPKTYNTK